MKPWIHNLVSVAALSGIAALAWQSWIGRNLVVAAAAGGLVVATLLSGGVLIVGASLASLGKKSPLPAWVEFEVGTTTEVAIPVAGFGFFSAHIEVAGEQVQWLAVTVGGRRARLQARRWGEVRGGRLVLVGRDVLGCFRMDIAVGELNLRALPRRCQAVELPATIEKGVSSDGPGMQVVRGDPVELKRMEVPQGRVRWGVYVRTGEVYAAECVMEPTPAPRLTFSMAVSHPETETAAAELARHLVERGAGLVPTDGFEAVHGLGALAELCRAADVPLTANDSLGRTGLALIGLATLAGHELPAQTALLVCVRTSEEAERAWALLGDRGQVVIVEQREVAA